MENKTVVGIGIASLLVIIVGFFGVRTLVQNDLVFEIEFDNAAGLTQGSKLMLSGVKIGEISAVNMKDDGRVSTKARVFREHEDKIKEGSAFFVRRPSLISLSGERLIEVRVADQTAEPLRSGSVVQGSSSTAAYWLYRSKEVVGGIKAPDLRNAVAGFADKAGDLQGMTKEQINKRLPKLKKEADELKNKLGKDGSSAASQATGMIDSLLGNFK